MTDPVTSEEPTFAELGLTDEVLRALSEMGFDVPTPVQRATYKPAVEGRDLVVSAQTGTGKTAAFGIPLVDRLIESDGGPQALILAPTRELALQSARQIARIAAHRDIQTIAVYGGAPMERQVREIRQGGQIISGTPGRVLDHLKRGTLDPASLRILILDEADEMLSMGFARELNAIISLLPLKRQTLLYSATIDDAVERMATRVLQEPERISISPAEVGAQGITHLYYLVSGLGRANDLIRIIEVENPESAIVFCNTRGETEAVASSLKQAGFNADWLNGELPQSEREKVLKRTRSGETRYLVATDVAARGIDISHLTHVINHDFPANIEGYIHRTGRTGRAGRTGTAVSLISPKELGALYYLRLQYKIFPIERTLPSHGELQTRREVDRIALLSEAFDRPPTEIDRAVARRLLTHPDADRLLGGLLGAFFGSRDGIDEEAAAARRDRPARPAAPPIADEPTTRPHRRPNDAASSDDGATADRSSTAVTSATGTPPSGSSQSEETRGESESALDNPDAVFLYMNLGRRDGIRPGEIIRLLAEECSIDRAEVGRIRIRDRHTFVGVPREHVENIVTQLSGFNSHDKQLVVEVARAQP